MEKRVKDIIKEARERYRGNSEDGRESYAVGWLAQSVYQLELDLKKANEKLASGMGEKIDCHLDRLVINARDDR